MSHSANCHRLMTFDDSKKVAVKADRHHIYLMPTSQRILRAIVDERRRVLARELHAQHHRPPLEDRLAQLKKQAEACREQTILLNAKLTAMSGEQFHGASELAEMRDTLLQSSAHIDHGVAGIVGK